MAPTRGRPPGTTAGRPFPCPGPGIGLTDSPPPPLRPLREAGGPCVEERVRDLAEREAGCCSFFSFTVTPGESLIGLGIVVDRQHEAVPEALAARASAGGQR
ncbi:hypothetical protein ACH4M4_33610 [Streptomyces sp. NPDC017254]|uniref:hypothetical protein n=1 Tax=unclassified Streptomyces TaxID=2593676 RepID=UPI0037A4A10A